MNRDARFAGPRLRGLLAMLVGIAVTSVEVV